MSLTPKQEAFARKYVETGNASAAYRFAYDADNMSLQVIHNEASKLLAHHEVSVTVDRLKAAYLAPLDVSASDVVRGLYEIASDADQPASARVSAWLGLAKRHPEFSDKHDVTVNKRTQALLAVSQMPLDQLLALAEGVEADAD